MTKNLPDWTRIASQGAFRGADAQSVVIGVVGASCRAAAQSLRQAGYQVAIADLFADHDTTTLGPVSQLVDFTKDACPWIKKVRPTAWCFTGGMENHPDLIDRMTQHSHLLGMGAAPLRLLRDPCWLSEIAKRSGLCFPETIRQEDATLIPANGWWLRKPVQSAGGLGIQLHKFDGEVMPENHLLQKHIPGPTMSVAILSTRERPRIIGFCQLSHGDDQAAPGPFVFTGAMTCSTPDEDWVAAIAKFVRNVHEEARPLGLWGIDFILSDPPAILEINPRWTATMPLWELLTARSLMGCHVAACLEQPAGLSVENHNNVAGLKIVYAPCHLEIKQEHVDQMVRLCREGHHIADIPGPATSIAATQPICTILAVAASSLEVAQRLDTTRETVLRLLAE